MAILKKQPIEAQVVSDLDRLKTQADKAQHTGTLATQQFRDAIDNLRLAAQDSYSVAAQAFAEAAKYQEVEWEANLRGDEYARQADAFEEALGLIPANEAKPKDDDTAEWEQGLLRLSGSDA